MSDVVIIGGHGKVALLLARALSGQGRSVRSTIRDEAQGADVEAAGAVPWTLDLEHADQSDVEDALTGSSAVVFSAGAGGRGGPERTRAVDLEGARRTIAAAQEAGVRRFVMVSAIGVDTPLPDDTADGWRAYVESKRDADATLRASGLDWTIVRPGRLTDGPATDQVRIGREVDHGEISRADVAAVVAAVLGDDSTIGAQFDLVGGEQTISDAIASLG